MKLLKSQLKANAIEKAKASLSEGTSLLTKRQKLILCADNSEFGWKTVEQYTQHELADDEKDAKKIRKRRWLSLQLPKDQPSRLAPSAPQALVPPLLSRKTQDLSPLLPLGVVNPWQLAQPKFLRDPGIA